MYAVEILGLTSSKRAQAQEVHVELRAWWSSAKLPVVVVSTKFNQLCKSLFLSKAGSERLSLNNIGTRNISNKGWLRKTVPRVSISL